MKAPTSEQVGVAWLNWLPGLDAPAATTRPAGTDWASTGFVVVSVVGDAGARDVPWSAPILRVDAWAVSPTSGLPPWAHAAGIAQIVREAALYGVIPPGALATATGYDQARVTSVWPVTEILRVPEPDGSSYAHYSVDIALGWARVPT